MRPMTSGGRIASRHIADRSARLTERVRPAPSGCGVTLIRTKGGTNMDASSIVGAGELGRRSSIAHLVASNVLVERGTIVSRPPATISANPDLSAPRPLTPDGHACAAGVSRLIVVLSRVW